jgi:nitrogen-specific signal transduction histidine kinase
MVLNLRDITERHDLEEQLRQSQKLEAIGKLAGGVAHDFNNVLTAILGYSDMLLYHMDPSNPLRDTVGEVRKAGMRGASLTHQLLAFSRKQVLQPAVLDLNAVVSNMQKMLRRLIGENVSLVTILEPDLMPVLADQGQIEQVILNLALNARDAMPEGGRLVVQTMNFSLYPNSAWVQGDFGPGDYALLQITDTGIGMEPETLAHMFEPFFTTKQPGQGTGLGLATVYGIVKQSGGHIWVSSRPGLGTAFKVYLPRTTQQKNIFAPRISAPAMSTGTETILLVEDEDSVRAMAAAVLKHCGYRVLEARHGGDALRVSRDFEGPIHLLLTDVVMPGMSGPVLAESIFKQRPEIRVLLTSGYIGQDQPGMDQWMKEENFLSKPFTAQHLSEKVRLVLDVGKDKLLPQS